MRKASFIMAMLMLFAVAFTSCGKRQHVNISKGLMTFTYSGGVDCFQIEADCDWSIEKDVSWCNVSVESGNKNAVVMVTVDWNDEHADRSAMLNVVSSNGKVKKSLQIVQQKIDFTAIVSKFWFLRTNERWNTDYYNHYIEDSYRSWTYYSDFEFENWFFYFLENGTGVQIRSKMGDTIYYPYRYEYFPEGDSLHMIFQTTTDTIENYHVSIMELNNQNFVFGDEYRPHQFEKLTTVNVTADRDEVKVNPAKIRPKPVGPLIPVE